MKLDNYISDLLYRYECVIIPEFGSFITTEISAMVNEHTNTFFPPKKRLAFNSQIVNNDGLLANYIASIENISFKDAMQKIAETVAVWNERLKNEPLDIPKVGVLELNKEGNIVFEPSTTENYLTSSFGLSSFISPKINRIAYKEQLEKLEKNTPIIPEKEHNTTTSFLKYAASFALIFTLGSLGWNTYNNNQYQKQILAEQQIQKELEQKIEQATFVIDSPLPEITLNVTKEVKNYYIVAGAFREVKNAEKKLRQLHAKGYSNAKIIGINKWNLTQVAYATFDNHSDATANLQEIKITDSKDAWLLIKDQEN